MNRGHCIKEIIESLHQSQRAACGRLSKVSGAAVTPSQWALLNLIASGKGMAVKEVAKALSISGSAVTQLANELVSKGYVRRVPDEYDKRAIRLLSTAKCKRMIDSIKQSFTESCVPLFNRLTDHELTTLSHLHKKIVASLEK